MKIEVDIEIGDFGIDGSHSVGWWNIPAYSKLYQAFKDQNKPKIKQGDWYKTKELKDRVFLCDSDKRAEFCNLCKDTKLAPETQKALNKEFGYEDRD